MRRADDGTGTATVDAPGGTAERSGTATPDAAQPSRDTGARAGLSRGTTAAVLAVVPVLGTVAGLVATRHGATVNQDSAAYLGAARNLLDGRGMTTPFDLSGSTLSPDQVFAFHGAVPLVHFPPAYPAVLAAMAGTGVSLGTGARVLDAVTLGLILVVFELLLRRCSGSSRLVPVAGALLLLAGPTAFFHENLLQIDTVVLSDPLFLLVFLGGLLLTVGLLAAPGRGRLIGLALCVGVAPLVRYVGLSIVVSAALVVWWWCPWPRPARRWAAAALVAAGLGPTLVWSVVMADVEHGGPVRSLAWHPPPDVLHGLVDIASGWLFPASMSFGLRAALFVVVVAGAAAWLAVTHHRRPEQSRPTVRLALVLAVFGASYLVVVLVTRYALDAATPLDNRILLPLIPLLYLFLVSVVVNAIRPASAGRLAAAALCLLGAAGAVGGTVTMVRQGAPVGGLSRTPTLQAIRRLPPGTLIASGFEDLVATDTGRASIRVPVRVEGLTNRPNPEFGAQVRQLATLLADHDGVLVVDPAAQSDFVTDGAVPADLVRVAPVHLVLALPDGGRLYRVGAPAP